MIISSFLFITWYIFLKILLDLLGLPRGHYIIRFFFFLKWDWWGNLLWQFLDTSMLSDQAGLEILLMSFAVSSVPSFTHLQQIRRASFGCWEGENEVLQHTVHPTNTDIPSFYLWGNSSGWVLCILSCYFLLFSCSLIKHAARELAILSWPMMHQWDLVQHHTYYIVTSVFWERKFWLMPKNKLTWAHCL